MIVDAVHVSGPGFNAHHILYNSIFTFYEFSLNVTHTRKG